MLSPYTFATMLSDDKDIAARLDDVIAKLAPAVPCDARLCSLPLGSPGIVRTAVPSAGVRREDGA
jgi:hypothetical protein